MVTNSRKVNWFDTDESRAIRVQEQVKNEVIFLVNWEKENA